MKGKIDIFQCFKKQKKEFIKRKFCLFGIA